MPSSRGRRIQLETYAVFLLLFGLILVLSHLLWLDLPYYWDEAGQFIPAALDIFHGGAWIPHSTVPNIHPPGLMAYLAAVWSLAGYGVVATRAAMLVLASFGVLAAFLLAIELSGQVRGMPAFLVVALLCVSPLFFAQSLLAQLDAPAMLFTCMALLLFLQDRIVPAAAVCVVLVMVKETGLVVPLVFAGRLAVERRWRDASFFLAPVAALAVWIAVLARTTGYWAGNPGYAAYNVYYPLHPVRLMTTLARRLYFLLLADFHWVGAIAIWYAWRKSSLFHTRSWRIAWLVVAAHVVMLTLFGGAVLERYLLPIMPILYTAMAAGLSLYPRTLQRVCAVVLLAGAAAANFINPPYPFPYEDNLAFTDFVRLQAETANYLQTWRPHARVSTIWPLTRELSHPELGYVKGRFAVEPLASLSRETLDRIDWSKVEILVAFSREWNPQLSIMNVAAVKSFWEKSMGRVSNGTAQEMRSRVPFPVEWHGERGGQWVDVYVNPSLRRFRDGELAKIPF
jgi:hypothetical protein